MKAVWIIPEDIQSNIKPNLEFSANRKKGDKVGSMSL